MDHHPAAVAVTHDVTAQHADGTSSSAVRPAAPVTDTSPDHTNAHHRVVWAAGPEDLPAVLPEPVVVQEDEGQADDGAV